MERSFPEDTKTVTPRLFSVPIAGGTAPKLLSDDVNASSDPDFRLDPAGTRVVFRRFGPGTHLFSAAVDGSSPPVRLDGFGASDTVTADFQILPGGERVLFKGGSFRYELHLVSIRGGRTLRLNGDLPVNGSVYSFSFGAPGFVYSANQDDPNQFELYHAVLTRHASR